MEVPQRASAHGSGGSSAMAVGTIDGGNFRQKVNSGIQELDRAGAAPHGTSGIPAEPHRSKKCQLQELPDGRKRRRCRKRLLPVNHGNESSTRSSCACHAISHAMVVMSVQKLISGSWLFGRR